MKRPFESHSRPTTCEASGNQSPVSHRPHPPATPGRTGWLDLHSHLLPGIDDGCRTSDDSLACVRQLLACGCEGTVCTPHVIPHLYPKNVPTEIERQVARLRSYLVEQGVEYQLWAGGEVRIHPDTIAWFEAHGVPTLGPGRGVLLDWWGDRWPAIAGEIFDYLLNLGYQPILAHPERMGFGPCELQRALDDVEAHDVWLQGNLNSLSGGEGEQAATCAWTLLEHGAYRLLASDMHRPESLSGRIRGLELVTERTGPATTCELMHRCPGQLIDAGGSP